MRSVEMIVDRIEVDGGAVQMSDYTSGRCVYSMVPVSITTTVSLRGSAGQIRVVVPNDDAPKVGDAFIVTFLRSAA